MLRAQSFQVEEHFRGAGYNDQTEDHGNCGWRSVVSHAGSRLLADVMDRTTLTGQLAETRAGLRKPRARHDPGRVLVDMAVAVADGATAISDVAVLADRAELFGAVASDSTCWRLLDRLDTAGVGRGRTSSGRGSGGGLGAARRTVRRAVPARSSGRQGAARLVIDLDASVVVCHSA